MTTLLSRAGRLLAASMSLLAAAALFHPADARAQVTPPPSCTQEPCGDGDNGLPPDLDVKPASGIYAQPAIPVLITVGDTDLLDASFRVFLDSVNVTGSFQFRRIADRLGKHRAAASGHVALTGTHTLTVEICDFYSHCSTTNTTYTYGAPGVSVTPNGGSVQVPAAGGAYTFRVRNPGPATATYSLLPSCYNGTGSFVSGCTAPGTVTVPSGDSASVVVSYAPMAAGQEVSVRLAARGTTDRTVEDAGWVDLEAVGAGTEAVPMVVQLVDLNSSGTVARDQCVTVAIAAGAAMECGDLRLVHALPAFVALGRTRAPTLVYSSAHVAGTARVYANVRLPANALVPTSVEVRAIRSDGYAYLATYPGSAWAAGATRRVAVVMEGMAAETGLYPYTLHVTAVYPGVSQTSQAQGEIAVVNRGASEFGPGWWLAGVERLYSVSGNRRLRVGGDGSTRVYNPAGTGVWVANTVNWRDTLWAGGIDGGYERRLPEGGRVTYRANGQHMGTVNRLDQHTRFGYDTSLSARLIYVDVPLQAGLATAKARYSFGLNASGRVQTVQAPTLGDSVLQVTLFRDAEHRVTAIRDLDNRDIAFGYDGRYVITRTDKRMVQTRFTWGPGRTLASSRLGVASADSIIQNLEPAEGKGIVSAVSLSTAHTLLDGPRTDVADHTRIWVGRFGAPQRIRDAAGGETVLTRGNASFPALVTEVRGPDASGSIVLRSMAVYDGRGRMQSSIAVNPRADGQNDTTSYAYHNAYNGVTSVAAPGQGVLTVRYDSLNGNRLWQQMGDSTRRVVFRYYDAANPNPAIRNMLRAVEAPRASGAAAAPVDSVEYDSWGNLRASINPLGFHTLYYKDARGRDTLVVTPLDTIAARNPSALLAAGARSRTGYDAMSRVLWTEALGPQVQQHQNPQNTYIGPGITPAEFMRVDNVYGDGGELLEVKRQSLPDSAGVGILRNQYTYDNAGRKLTENDGSGPLQRFEYDPAGNVVTWVTQRASRIRSEYDALGRLVKRTVPETAYPSACPPGESMLCPLYRFPFYSTNGAGGYSIAAEVFIYRYNLAGQQTWAENRDARVSRGYYPGGALRADTIRMRSYEGMDYSQHVYGIQYGYDAAGRLSWVQHPGNLATTGSQTDSYGYHPVTGALTQVTGRLGHVFQFGYDEQERMIWQAYPSGIERSTYDIGGRRRSRVDSTTVEGELSRETHDYDARGKLVHSYTEFDGDGSHSDNWYSGLGNLVATNWSNVEDNAANIELFSVDAMGNQRRRSTQEDATPVLYQTQYGLNTGRVTRITRLPSENPAEPPKPDSTMRSYDSSGNVEWAREVAYKNWYEVSNITATWNLYGADEKLRVLQTENRSPTGAASLDMRGLFSEYRYDALGRRIMERTRRDTVCNGTGAGECASTITRFIWSGDQLLWELRANGSNGQNQELTDGTGGQYGRVHYLHGAGIDRPLLITKGGTSVIPHDNWRGAFATGTLANGQRAECHGTTVTNCLWIVWPGWKTTASHARTVSPSGQSDWWGGLVDGMRDVSGRMYMRNRYYDPATGQFTQTDPIGLAGGLNSYGFAAGDPVTYSDPYGLTATENCDPPRRCPGWEYFKNDVLHLNWLPMHIGQEQPKVYIAAGVEAGPVSARVRVDDEGIHTSTNRSGVTPSASAYVALGSEKSTASSGDDVYSVGAGAGLVGGNIEMARSEEGTTRELTREVRIGPSRPSVPFSVGVNQAQAAVPYSTTCWKAAPYGCE